MGSCLQSFRKWRSSTSVIFAFLSFILTDVTVYPVAVPLFNRADWWSPAPGDDWEPVEQGEFDDVKEPDQVSHLA